MVLVLGEMDVVWVNPYRSGQGESPVHMARFARRRPSNPGGDSRSESHPVSDVRQARITWGVGGWGITFGKDEKEGMVVCLFLI